MHDVFASPPALLILGVFLPAAFLVLPLVALSRPDARPATREYASWGLVLAALEMLQFTLLANHAESNLHDSAMTFLTAGLLAPISYVGIGITLAAVTRNSPARRVDPPAESDPTASPERPRITHLGHLLMFTAEAAWYLVLLRSMLQGRGATSAPVASVAPAIFLAVWLAPAGYVLHRRRRKRGEHYLALAAYAATLFVFAPRAWFDESPLASASALTGATLFLFSVVVPMLWLGVRVVGLTRERLAEPATGAAGPQ